MNKYIPPSIGDLLQEVFGHDYLGYEQPERLTRKQAVTRAKLLIIEPIMRIRASLGYKDDGTVFDSFLDMEIPTLHSEQIKYEDLMWAYQKAKEKRESWGKYGDGIL